MVTEVRLEHSLNASFPMLVILSGKSIVVISRLITFNIDLPSSERMRGDLLSIVFIF